MWTRSAGQDLGDITRGFCGAPSVPPSNRQHYSQIVSAEPWPWQLGCLARMGAAARRTQRFLARRPAPSPLLGPLRQERWAVLSSFM
jgi:hypothetical protein